LFRKLFATKINPLNDPTQKTEKEFMKLKTVIHSEPIVPAFQHSIFPLLLQSFGQKKCPKGFPRQSGLKPERIESRKLQDLKKEIKSSEVRI
jgi:hypothetical protein